MRASVALLVHDHIMGQVFEKSTLRLNSESFIGSREDEIDHLLAFFSGCPRCQNDAMNFFLKLVFGPCQLSKRIPARLDPDAKTGHQFDLDTRRKAVLANVFVFVNADLIRVNPIPVDKRFHALDRAIQ